MSIPETMKAIHLPNSPSYSYANPCRASSLLLDPSFPIPIASPTECFIRVHATAISPYELTWEGAYTLTSPRIPYFDIAGTIVSSPASSGFMPGDRVFGLLSYLSQGGMAEYAVSDPKLLAKIPDGVGFVEAASLPRASLTAWQAVVVKGEEKGEKGQVVAVGGKGSEALKKLGADDVVNYREVRDWETLVRGEGGVDWVLDCVGGTSLEKCLGIVKDGGQIVTIGSPPPVWEKVEGWRKATERGVKELFFIVGENSNQLVKIAELVRTGDIKPSISLVIDTLTEAGVRDAWKKAEKGVLSGSVVVKIL